MRSIVEDLVQNDGPVDEQEILNRELFDVNMRLYNNNANYHQVVSDVVRLMIGILSQTYDDYGALRDMSSANAGISGANVGIPWNIIAFKHGSIRNIMINPKIVGHSLETVKVKSNCGSLRLAKNVDVERWVWIDVEYYDCDGVLHHEYKVTKQKGGFTIQHEIAHNQGVLVTSKKQIHISKPTEIKEEVKEEAHETQTEDFIFRHYNPGWKRPKSKRY